MPDVYKNKTFNPFTLMGGKLVVAIDGPAGTGKSETARLVAQKLNYIHYNSGMTYRGITFILLREIGPEQVECLETESFCQCVEHANIQNTGKNIVYNGEVITGLLRTPRIDRYVSITSKVRQIRKKCKKILRDFVDSCDMGLIVEGRDIGTQVLPDADVKIYLTASTESRARRRMKQTGGRYPEILEGIIRRDNDDINREVGPLKCAEDATSVDNSNIGLEETVDLISDIVRDKLKVAKG